MSEKKSATQLLLGCNLNELQKPTKEIDVPRLQELCGDDFKVVIKSLNTDKYKEVMNEMNVSNASDFGSAVSAGTDAAMLAIKLGIVEPDINNQELRDKLEVATWVDCINKLFLPGEINMIGNEIINLSEGEAPKKRKASKKKEK